MEHLGPTVGSTLAQAYVARVDYDGEGVRPRAAELLAHDLRQGDPSKLKAGYSRENAILAALDVFPDVDRDELAELLDELTKTQRAAEQAPRLWAREVRRFMSAQGFEVDDVEEDCNGAPHGTLDYEWSAAAFIARRGRREFRVVVEETTVEEEA